MLAKGCTNDEEEEERRRPMNKKKTSLRMEEIEDSIREREEDRDDIKRSASEAAKDQCYDCWMESTLYL